MGHINQSIKLFPSHQPRTEIFSAFDKLLLLYKVLLRTTYYYVLLVLRTTSTTYYKVCTQRALCFKAHSFLSAPLGFSAEGVAQAYRTN